MSDQNLEYNLEIDFQKADKEFQALTERWGKALDALSKRPIIGSSSSPDSGVNKTLQNMETAHKKTVELLKGTNTLEKDINNQRVQSAQKVAEAQVDANTRRYKSDRQYQSAVGALNDKYLADLAALAARAADLTRDQVNSELQAIRIGYSAKVGEAKQNAQEIANLSSQLHSRIGGFGNRLYMVQQAVEDFSYAGLRGATNNLAFIASTIAGPAGTAAMVGMLGLQFAYSTGMLEKFDKELGVSEKLMALFGMRSKEQIELNKKEAESHLALYQARMETREALAKFSITDFDKPQNEKAQRDKAIDIELMQKQVAQLERLKATYDAYVAAKAKGNTLDNLRNPTSLDEIRNAFKGGDADKLLRDAVNQGNALGIAINPEEMQKVSGELDSVRDSLRKLIEEADRLQQLENKFKSFGASFDKYKQGWKDIEFSNEQKDTTGMTSKGADVFRDFLERQGQSVEEYRKTLDQWVESHQDVPGVLDKANEALRQSTENWDKQAESLQKTLKHQGDVVSATDKAISKYEQYISKLDRAIEKEGEHRDSLAMERSAFEDNATKRQMSALDRIDDLKASEKKESLQSQFGYAQNQLQQMKQRDEAIAQQMAQGMGKGGSKWLSNVGNQIDAYYEMLGQKNKNFLAKQMEQADEVANTNKQKRLDDLKNQLGDKADKLTGEAQKAMEGGNLEKASDSLKKAMKTMEELQQAQEKAIGQSSSKQAEQIEKDLKGSSDKIRQLFDMMDEVSQKNTEKLQGDHTRALEFMQELEMRKRQAEAVDPYAPTAFEQLDEIMQRIKAIGDEKMRVASIPFQMGGMNGMMAGGSGGFGGGGPINSTINVNMAGSATPSAAMAAARAAAASIVMQRA